uniref:Phosphoglycolate phosphatase n=1 Tax=Lotharella globosa TaxID=91324 RepID=A0A6U2ZAY6_9EUKA|mmetsp:Transcript_190/g.397  ORF Transcript_190/g.397 Transcript_190/m.397 type:complete len:381 (-) Transcript_190:234-1376(-)
MRAPVAAVLASAMLVFFSVQRTFTRAPRLTASVGANVSKCTRKVSGSLRGLRTRGGSLASAGNPMRLSATHATSYPVSSTAVASPPKVDTIEKAKGLLDSIDTIIFDCDGVIWKGDTLIDGIPETIDFLRQQGKSIYFVTNNARKSRAGFKKKFDDLGLQIKPEEILSSAFAAAAYLDKIDFQKTGKSVYVIGDVGIGEELDLLNIPWQGGVADQGKQIELKSGFALPHDPNVGAVIVGFDYGINYYKIQYAQLCINENPGCHFIATNLDALTHLTDAQEWAGNGAMVGAIKGCTGKEPVVVGKPSPLLIDYLVQKFGLQKDRILMVGDRLDTDIVFGNENGLKSCLTLTGVTTEKKLLSDENKIIPDVYVDSINAFRGA